MPAYYVASTGNNSDGLTWAKAFTAFAGAVTAASADGDIIYVDQGFTDALAADATYTFGNHVRVICTNDKVNEPPQTLGSMGTSAWIGSSSASYAITLTGGYKVYLYGITLRNAGSAGKNFTINNADGGHFELENCYLWLGTTSSTARLSFGSSTTTNNNFCVLTNCTYRFGSTSQKMVLNQFHSHSGCVLSSDGSAPSVLITSSISNHVLFEACDLSHVTGTLIDSMTSGASFCQFVDCKINASLTAVIAAQATENKSSANAWLYNCSGGDTHYHLQHHDAFGSTVIDTGIYANDGAQYDGTNRCSWKIVTTAACNYYTPYVSPWIDCYHSGTSAITPSLEIVRSGSATAYQDDEIWGEFSYQGTSGVPLATFVSDRKALLAAAADQTTGALNASGWTGENATSWFGKLNPTATITPAEIGHLRARVCVGEPSITVYVDPTIRGRS